LFRRAFEGGAILIANSFIRRLGDYNTPLMLMFVDGLPEVLAFLLSETIPHSNKNGSLMYISAIKMHNRAANGHKLSIDAGLAMSIRRNDSRAMVGRICVFDQLRST
jgi:hypothetical protein